MRDATRTNWPALCSYYEGRCYWLYLDTLKLPTTGLGHRVFTVEDMAALPWLKDGSPATQAQKIMEWSNVLGRGKLAAEGGFAYDKVTTLRLSSETVDKLLTEDTLKYWNPLVKVLPDLESWPVDAQLAILDMSYNLGPNFLGSKWPNFTAAAKAGDFNKMAATCLRAAKAPRDYRHQRLFLNAGLVKDIEYAIAYDIFWDTTTPALPSVPVPTPVPIPTTPKPENPVKHSNSYKSDYVWFRGGNVPPIVEKVLKAIPSDVQLSQGGLSNSVPASGQTHNGLGAYDISVKGWSKSKIMTLCAELIRSGEVAFPRGGWFGSAMFSTHVHVCSNNSYNSLHYTAKDQINDFKKGRNGLVGHAKYVGPKTPLGSWKDSPYNPDNIKEIKGTYVVVADALLGLDVDRNQKEKKKKGDKITFVRQVKRWGRWNGVTSKGRYFAISVDGKAYLKPVEVKKPTPPPVVVTPPPVVVNPPIVTDPPVIVDPPIVDSQRDGTRGN